MRNTIAIARKELNLYFTTTIAYSCFGAFAFIMGLMFIGSLNRFQQFTQHYLAQQQPDALERLNFNDSILTPMFGTAVWLFLFFIPFLTMRLIAEEKSARTFELLLTAPVRSLEIVLGKFVGVAAIIFVLSAIPLLYPLILSAYGSGTQTTGGVEWPQVWTGLGMLFLLGLTFASIGLFISSLTESQIVAALLTFAALLFTFILPLLAGRLEGNWREVLEFLSPASHTQRAVEGRLVLADAVYFASTIFLFLFFTFRAVESNRWR